MIILFLGYGTANTNQSKCEELLCGKWTIISSTFNDRGSPVPKNISLEFRADHRVEGMLPNYGENEEDISGLGTWTKSNGFVKVEWDDEELWGQPQHGKILKLTKSKLHWELEMVGGIQEEVYKRKK